MSNLKKTSGVGQRHINKNIDQDQAAIIQDSNFTKDGLGEERKTNRFNTNGEQVRHIKIF